VYGYAQELKKAGRTEEAIQAYKQLITLQNGQSPGTRLYIASYYLELNQPDSTIAWVRRAVDAGDNKEQAASLVDRVTQPLLAAAQASKAIEDYQKVVTHAKLSDSLVSAPTPNFFWGIASYFIGEQAIKLSDESKSCDLAKLAKVSFEDALLRMSKGGSVDAGTAGQIMQFAPQQIPLAESRITAYCKSPTEMR
jgi:tetratricopeptide (TPR) repeat protein